MQRKLTWLWLALGLGSQLQIVASLSITELMALISAPFILANNYQLMKRDGILPFFWMSLLVIVGCVIGSVMNQSPPGAVLRGMATTCLIPCSIILAHWILRHDASGFKWMLVGGAISVVLCTFIFQRATEVGLGGDADVERIMAGPLFWIERLGAFVTLPTRGWYLSTPGFINMTAPLFMTLFSMLTSVSGRSAALGAVGFVALVVIGGKTRKSISRISKYFWQILCAGFLAVLFLHGLYRVSAESGWLGEKARAKYESQTHGEKGIMRLLIGGRGDSFIGLLACRDSPIIGLGPWAMDEKGYVDEFMAKYGTREDYAMYQRSAMRALERGEPVNLLRCHSYIVQFWVWYGIFGLMFWIYVIFVLFRYLKEDCFAVPQWFAWLACGIPSMVWDIFFSPFKGRFGLAMFVTACLMVRSVRKGTFRLPDKMLVEIESGEKKWKRP